ncbi:MAG: bifunctional DNA-formamidopyrimidine glycosylase/DNA-(apurinic or apyrimidinic site) lyase [Pirellulales bacterium]|nr:bifunctional DNA-formamidopyrimidine glycosylase/DNA-(apurinic or apyrimidinic site) lyase [Pirellulales bacterium]
MPELPEVETMCRGIKPILGSRIVDVTRPRSRLQSIIIVPRFDVFRRRIKDRKIMGIGRLGKRVVLELDSGDRLVLEPRMSGLILLRRPPNETHLRLIFKLKGGKAGQFLFWDQRGLGVASLLAPKEFSNRLGPEKIGPDALAITAELLRERMGHGRRPIKVALMDQRLLAGIGNLYASEILHRCRIHPARPCQRLRPKDWLAVHAAMREVLDDAILHQGSTLRDGTYRIARNEPGNFQIRHRVYQRHGERCLQCGRAEILRIVQAQRSTFFCPACQHK